LFSLDPFLHRACYTTPFFARFPSLVTFFCSLASAFSPLPLALDFSSSLRVACPPLHMPPLAGFSLDWTIRSPPPLIGLFLFGTSLFFLEPPDLVSYDVPLSRVRYPPSIVLPPPCQISIQIFSLRKMTHFSLSLSLVVFPVDSLD